MEQLLLSGLQLVLDDFGTGYSSLGYLKRLPLSTFKIDRSFVMNISENPGNQEIVKAMVQLALAFNLDVIVEGVENKEDLAFIRTLPIKYTQGYHFYKAKTADALIKIFNDPPS
jgi:EAL domain-containing protein (putative c-di-GMP-specific phosphodiesterase class I)